MVKVVVSCTFLVVLSFFYQLRSVSSQCDGCGQYATCDVIFVESAVYGCGGEWTSEGVTHGSYLCADGYHICDDPDYALSIGLTYELCTQNDTLVPENYYYVSMASSDGSKDCSTSGSNDLFGCGTSTSTNPTVNSGIWLDIDNNTISCGPFGALMSTDTAENGGWVYGWEPWGQAGDGNTTLELNRLRHLKDQHYRNGGWSRTGNITGGLLCCIDDDGATNPPQTTDDSVDVSIIYDNWRSRTIYQLLTDRFAVADTANERVCSDLSKYCNGTFRGIIDKIDYIYDLGFDAIWISPIVSNTVDGYHGYWASNIDTINSYFGTDADLMELSTLLHSKDMLLIVDIVCNHMGYQNSANLYDFSGLEPFDDKIYYHRCNNDSSITETNNINGCATDDCNIDDYDSAESQICRLAGLPDLNTTNPDVIDIFCQWANDIVSKYNIDGLRIDTVKHVDYDFWVAFMGCINNNTNGDYSDYLWATGEFFSGVSSELSPYQSDDIFASLLSFPMYYSIRDVFGTRDQGLWGLKDRFEEYEDEFGADNIWLLAGFIDNHDVNRWLCSDNGYDTGMEGLKNALAFLFTFRNIPVLYYGTEQEFDGCEDPENREPLWEGNGYDQDGDLYRHIQILNWARREYEIYNDDSFNILDIDDTFMVYNRGSDMLVVLISDPDTSSYDVELDSSMLSNIADGTFCNILGGETAGDSITDCFDSTSSSVTITLIDGLSKIYALDYTVSITFNNTFEYGGNGVIDDDDSTSSMAPVSSIMTTLATTVTTMLASTVMTTQDNQDTQSTQLTQLPQPTTSNNMDDNMKTSTTMPGNGMSDTTSEFETTDDKSQTPSTTTNDPVDETTADMMTSTMDKDTMQTTMTEQPVVQTTTDDTSGTPSTTTEQPVDPTTTDMMTSTMDKDTMTTTMKGDTMSMSTSKVMMKDDMTTTKDDVMIDMDTTTKPDDKTTPPTDDSQGDKVGNAVMLKTILCLIGMTIMIGV